MVSLASPAPQLLYESINRLQKRWNWLVIGWWLAGESHCCNGIRTFWNSPANTPCAVTNRYNWNILQTNVGHQHFLLITRWFLKVRNNCAPSSSLWHETEMGYHAWKQQTWPHERNNQSLAAETLTSNDQQEWSITGGNQTSTVINDRLLVSSPLKHISQSTNHFNHYGKWKMLETTN